MKLELNPPYPPMEALSVNAIPQGPGWQYEPKWDGFRCLAFREGDRIDLQSKAGQPLGRYFPEVVASLSALKPECFVLDGEIVIPAGDRLSFDDLLQRIHPAESRIRKLSKETPALLILFDLLAGEDGKALVGLPLSERRPLLEAFVARHVEPKGDIRLSPTTTEAGIAQGWLESAGWTLDGVVAKRLDLPYRSGDRTGMQKVKPERTLDCVIGGFRYGSGSKVVGSLLLGLYDEEGLLHHVGFTSGLKASEKQALTELLQEHVQPPGFTGQAPGGPSRWSTERSTEWVPLAPKLVIEVAYAQFTDGRFRHGTRLLRWRPDKDPRQCTLDQVQHGGASLALIDGPES